MSSFPATIFVTFDHTGIHCWPNAPDHRGYLRDPHRHIFKVRVECQANHDDREIEFHDLIGVASLRFEEMTKVPEFLSASCEMMARNLGAYLHNYYGRRFTVTVSEDGECGLCNFRHL